MGILFDKIVNIGVLRYISNGIGQNVVYCVGNILVRGLECFFNRVVGVIVFGYFVVICCGCNNCDICFGCDVVVYVVLGNISIQLVNNNLQINCVVRFDYIVLCCYLFFQDFL